MPEYDITIKFLSDWHVGSGLGDGSIADSILNRDSDGLPYIPGRAVKGALRESAWRLGLCRRDLADMVEYLFGRESGEETRSFPGCLTAGTAELPADLRAWMLAAGPAAKDQLVEAMTIHAQRTALTEDRQAKEHSLRAIECGIPGLEFHCKLAIDADIPENWLDAYINALCAGVKSIGADRSRGLGRCSLRVDGGDNGPVHLPPVREGGGNAGN